ETSLGELRDRISELAARPVEMPDLTPVVEGIEPLRQGIDDLRHRLEELASRDPGAEDRVTIAGRLASVEAALADLAGRPSAAPSELQALDS
ncbi:hypothetical protein ACQUFE_17825, partial [Enterococcus casseliflavus]|uniref:hypothetical protein n=1 Tax=Enterococcus casseliflavus TaxID=37734 RepID=UPI003D0E5A76